MMEHIVELINGAAGSWWNWVSRSTWQGSVVLFVIVAVLFVWRKASPRWRHGLLLIALVKFVMPPISAPFGLFGRLPNYEVPLGDRFENASDRPMVPSTAVTGIPTEEESPLPGFTDKASDVGPVRSSSAVSTVEQTTPKASLTVLGWILAAQIAGVFSLLAFLWSQARVVRRRLKGAERVLTGPIYEQATATLRRLGLRRMPAIYIDDVAHSPQVGGFFRHFILLPSWIRQVSAEDRPALVAHELAHLRRLDPLVNGFQIAVQVWLWWNPFVCRLNRWIRTEREMCCDDLVLALGLAGNESYSRVLVDTAERLGRRELTFEMIGMADAFRPIRNRVKRTLNSRLKRPLRLSVASFFVLLLLAGLVLPGLPSAKDEIREEPAVAVQAGDDEGLKDEMPAEAPAEEDPVKQIPPDGTGLSFDGIDDYLEVPGAEDLDIGNTFTVEAWVKAGEVTGERSILSKEIPWQSGWTLIIWAPMGSENADLCGITFAVGDGTRFYNLTTAIIPGSPSVPQIEKNVRHHVAATWDNGKCALLVDGQLACSQVFPNVVPAGVPLRIGKGSADLGRHFNGELGDIRIWSVVRSEDEIRKSMTEKPTGKESGLIVYWSLNKSTGRIARDLTGHGHDAEAHFATERNYLGQTNFPKIVKLDPPNGSKDVDPALEYITVVFDRSMRGGYSWVDKGQCPQINEINWINDHECRASVTLKQGREYGLWLNFGPNTSKFRSVEGISADRVYWRFVTAGEGSSELSEDAELQELTEATPNLLASMQAINGCTMERVADGVRLSCGRFRQHAPRIRTEGSYRPPFAVKAKAMTDSTNLRLYYGEAYSDPSNCGRLIFNWELNQRDLRIHEPVTGKLLRPSGNGYITPNEWHDVVWEIRPDGMRVVVDGEERFRGTGDYSNAQERLGIGPDLGSTVGVQSFVVEPLMPEAPPKNGQGNQ